MTRNEGGLSGDSERREKMDNADSKLEGSTEPVYTPQGGTEVIEFEDQLKDYS
ncbi:MAG: hypothetical protein JKX81_09870 [Arenicella sp.]|nr:hypothetical protein [Arenicella sp.]